MCVQLRLTADIISRTRASRVPIKDRYTRLVGWVTRQYNREPKYLYSKGLKKSQYHMHKGIHELGGKIDKIYWVLLGTVGAVSLFLLERVLDIKGIIF